MNKHTAISKVTIHAPKDLVWQALTTPELIKQYMMGADVHTDWKVGSPLTYTGEYQGKKFEEKGEIKELTPGVKLAATHFSSMSGKPDVPENYALVTWALEDQGGHTVVSVSQDNIESAEGVAQSKASWSGVLKTLKLVVEKS